MQSIILASSSVYRKNLLQKLRLPFQAISPDIDETRLGQESPSVMVMRLALAKARALAGSNPDALIIGSDQCAVLDDTVLGKPGNFEAAFEQLANASGRTVVFHTSLCLLNVKTGEHQLEDVETRVSFRLLRDDQIYAYLKKEEPYDCAGSFRAEAQGIALFERILGDDPNALIGLPLIRLTRMLAREGIDVLS